MIKTYFIPSGLKLILVFVILLFVNFTKAQLSSTDSVQQISISKIHSPKRAATFSAMLPGLGQAYNKKYWKIPVIYIGFGALAYSFTINQQKFSKYKNAYAARIDGDPYTIDDYVNVYTDENLNTLQRYYHRYRDLSAIGVAAFYLLNIIDASVDAHFFTFDISDNLSLNIRPTLIPTAYGNAYNSGVSILIKL